jgi:hypothetical protein
MYIISYLACPFRFVSTFLHTGGVCLHIHTGGCGGDGVMNSKIGCMKLGLNGV